MFAIGDSLREARNRRGLTAADVQKGIRIRERYLTALEEEHWDMLPGDAYTKGFLRTYAEFLGLNGNLYIDEYNARIAHRDEDPPLVPGSLASHRGRSGVLGIVVAVLALGALVAAVVAWRVGGSTKAPSRPHASAAAAIAASSHSASAAAAKPVLKHTAAQPAATVAFRTTIKATRGRCWLSVRIGGPAGRELYRGILEKGKALHYHLGGDLWVRMGRPLLLDITAGGHQVQGLTASPGNVLLTPDGAQAA